MTKKAAAKPDAGKKRSRTIYLTDEEWGAITALADKHKRTRTAQIMVLVYQAQG